MTRRQHYSRYYYIGNDLDDMDQLAQQLQSRNIAFERIHVLTKNDAKVMQNEHIHEVPSLLQNDIVHSTELGALVGLVLTTLTLLIIHLSGLAERVGWLPFIFLAIVIFGFCTWEGSFLGFQNPNKDFVRFEGVLEEGKHLFFLDIDASQKPIVDEVLQHYPELTPAGTGPATPNMVIKALRKWHEFRKAFP